MISERRNFHPYRRLIFYGIISCLLFTVLNTNISAQSHIDPDFTFIEFWSDYESVFLFYPQLVEEVFLNIIDLKGNQKVARKHIADEVLACKFGYTTLSECRLDQLKLNRKKEGFSNIYSIPANITHISAQPSQKDKNQYILSVDWLPVMFQPPVVSVKKFFHYLGAADNSKYYTLKQGLNSIQINSLFENRVSVITSKATAINLLKLYRDPPSDLKDEFMFEADMTDIKRVYDTANVDFHLKAVKIKLNHQVFLTTKELLL